MPTSIRLNPEIGRLLDQRAKRERKTRTALIHEALDAWLKPPRPNLGGVIRAALSDVPDGFAIEREQPTKVDPRDWQR